MYIIFGIINGLILNWYRKINLILYFVLKIEFNVIKGSFIFVVKFMIYLYIFV